MPRPRSAVLIHQGSPGGIGQVEFLLDRAGSALCDEIVSLRRNSSTMLNPSSAPTGFGSKAQFSLTALQTVAKTRPDLLLITHLNLVFLALAARLLSTSSRIICIAHGIEAWSPRGLASQAGLSAVDAVWCVSEFTQGVFRRESGIPSTKVHVLPLGLSTVKSDLIEQAASTNENMRVRRFQLLSVTRLQPGERYKGVEHVLLALARVRIVDPRFHLTVVGDGADRRSLESLSKELGVADSVEFRGRLDDKELAGALKQCDAFILPSAKEGFGLAHLEAMCAAKPVLAAHAGATPEVVIDGETGILTRYADTEGLADAILALMHDRRLRNSLGQEGRSRFLDRFTEVAFRARVQALVELL